MQTNPLCCINILTRCTCQSRREKEANRAVTDQGHVGLSAQVEALQNHSSVNS